MKLSMNVMPLEETPTA